METNASNIRRSNKNIYFNPLSTSNNNIKTIALVANSTWNIYNFRLNLIDKFIAEGMDVVVIAPVDEYLTYKEKYPKVRHYGLRFLDRDSTNPVRDILLLLELVRKYKKIKPDILLHFTNKPNIYGGIAAKLVGIKSVAVVTGLGYAFINKGFVRAAMTWLYKFSARYHHMFIFENIEDRELFQDLGIVSKDKSISVKGCGVNIDYFHPYPNARIKEKTIFTFIGRLLYDKGIREFVEAARQLKQVRKDVEFWIVGELDAENPATIDKDDLIKWVEEDIIYYHGFVKDVRPIIANSDCIVLPSYREGLPRIIIEGMAMSKPVITTHVAGCEETVDHGINGFLVTMKDVSDLVISMNEFLALPVDSKHLMGQEGREKAVNEFDDKKIAKDIFNIVAKL